AVSGAGAFGATVGGDGVVGECITSCEGFAPSGRRWAFSAIRPSVSTAPATRKYFKINIIAPQAACPAASQLVAPATCGVHLQPYIDTGPAYVPAHRREPAGGSSNSSGHGRGGGQPGMGNRTNENPPRISPGGPTLIPPSLPPGHPRAEAPWRAPMSVQTE